MVFLGHLPLLHLRLAQPGGCVYVCVCVCVCMCACVRVCVFGIPAPSKYSSNPVATSTQPSECSVPQSATPFEFSPCGASECRTTLCTQNAAQCVVNELSVRRIELWLMCACALVADAGAAHLLPGDAARDGARHPLLLGRTHGHDGAAAHGTAPLQGGGYTHTQPHTHAWS